MSLVENTKTALDESRTLMLGAQILLGFQLQAPSQNAFVSLTSPEKVIEVAVLCIMVLVLGLLIAPSARHRIVEQGEATAGTWGGRKLPLFRIRIRFASSARRAAQSDLAADSFMPLPLYRARIADLLGSKTCTRGGGRTTRDYCS